MERPVAGEIPLIHLLQAQADLLLLRLLAPGASLAFGDNTLATCSSSEPEHKSFLLGFCISSVVVILAGLFPGSLPPLGLRKEIIRRAECILFVLA